MDKDTNPTAPATQAKEGVQPTAIEDRLRAYLDRGKPTPKAEDDNENQVADEDDAVGVDDEDEEPTELPEGESGDDPEEDEEESDDSEDLPPEFFAKKVKAVVNGEEIEITVDEAAKGYQRLQDYTRKSQEAARVREQLSGSIEEYKKGIEVIAQFMSQEIQAYKALDWDALKAANPNEYALKKLEAQEADQRYNALRQTWQASVKKQNELNMDAMREIAAQEEQKLMRAMPEWKNEKTRNEMKSNLDAYVQTVGFTVQELHNVLDHRYYVVLNKARLYDEMTKKSDGLKDKRVKEVTRVVKKGTHDPISGSEKKLKTATENFIKNKDMASAAELLKQRWNRSK